MTLLKAVVALAVFAASLVVVGSVELGIVVMVDGPHVHLLPDGTLGGVVRVVLLLAGLLALIGIPGVIVGKVMRRLERVG